jgi:hypothetical protein
MRLAGPCGTDARSSRTRARHQGMSYPPSITFCRFSPPGEVIVPWCGFGSDGVLAVLDAAARVLGVADLLRTSTPCWLRCGSEQPVRRSRSSSARDAAAPQSARTPAPGWSRARRGSHIAVVQRRVARPGAIAGVRHAAEVGARLAGRDVDGALPARLDADRPLVELGPPVPPTITAAGVVLHAPHELLRAGACLMARHARGERREEKGRARGEQQGAHADGAGATAAPPSFFRLGREAPPLSSSAVHVAEHRAFGPALRRACAFGSCRAPALAAAGCARAIGCTCRRSP